MRVDKFSVAWSSPCLWHLGMEAEKLSSSLSRQPIMQAVSRGYGCAGEDEWHISLVCNKKGE